MKKRYIILVLLTFSLFCFADPIDKNAARKIAEEFYKQQVQTEFDGNRQRSKKKPKFTLDYICKNDSKKNKRTKRNNEEESNLYYIFNADKKQGFVIIAGDDKAGEVLAYSKSGNFSHSEMPDNLKFLMESYKKAIIAIVNDEVKVDINPSERSSDAPYSKKVLALLGKEGIKWGQNTPFNNDCPMETLPNDTESRTVSGCLATAMTQVMRYHKHPQQGKGEKTYTTRTLKKTLTADFNTTYNWNKMPAEYIKEKYKTDQASEVAKLTYHVGVSIEMDYTSGGSAAYTKSAKKSLVEYFSYDKNIAYLKRELYSRDEWYSIIKKELNEKRPVIYAGASKRGGHAFVCDGYDSNDLFHINWGWNGQSDGHFDLTILEPSSQGTGGGSGGYSKSQEILIGIQPETNNSTPALSSPFSFEELELPKLLKQKKSNSFDLKIKNLENSTDEDYNNGTLRLVLENESQICYTLKELTGFSLKEGYLYPIYTLKSVKAPSNTPNGIYKLRLQLKDLQSEKYITAVAINESFKELSVEVSDNHIEFKHKKLEPNLELVGEPEVKNDKLYKDKNAEITVNLKNIGNASFRSKIGVALTALKNGEKEAAPTLIDSISLEIVVGETRTLTFKPNIKLAPGKYLLEFITTLPNDKNGKAQKIIGQGKKIEILAKPEEAKLSFNNLNYNKNTTRGETFNLSFDIKNEGGITTEYFNLYIFKRYSKDGKYEQVKNIRKSIPIDGGKTESLSFEMETKDLQDSKSLAEELNEEKEAAYILIITHKRNKLKFKLKQNGKDFDQFAFYINPPKKSFLSCNPSSFDEILITNKGLSLDLVIKNSGAKYNDKIRVDFADNQENIKASTEELCTIDKSFTLKITDSESTKQLPSGTYTINILYKNNEGVFTPIEGTYGYLEIKIPKTEFEIDNTIPQAELKFNLSSDFKYDVKISNAGGAFNEKIYLDIIPSEETSKRGQKTITLSKDVNIARGNVGEASFSEKLEKSKYKAGSYTVQVKLKRKTSATIKLAKNQDAFVKIGDPIKFILLNEDGSSIETPPKDNKTPSIDENPINKEPEEATLSIRQYAGNLELNLPQDCEIIYIYDMTGRLLSKNNLAAEQTEFTYKTSKTHSGVYILVIEGKDRRIVEKVLIK